MVQAVVPAPDGGYPGGNTAEGQSALLSLTTGGFNTAVGFFSLRSVNSGSFNTGVGAGTLFANTGDGNTATGTGALLSHSTGNGNTANGAFALFSDTSGQVNTATGDRALLSNTTGGINTATGALALLANTIGHDNTADGVGALESNITGNNNVAVGAFAGVQQTTGSNNVYIGANVGGPAGESDACYIKSIFGQTSSGGIPVLINANHKLGMMTSSKRFKEDIKPMDMASEALYALTPVSFHYKKEIDPAGISQFGLMAEEVEKVNPDLVVRDLEGKPYSVRYDQVNAMLLNEFLKEHKKVEDQQREMENQQASLAELKSTVAQQQKGMEILTAQLKEQAVQIQKVSAQVEVNNPAAKVVTNKP
jgi:hypothetical protein